MKKKRQRRTKGVQSYARKLFEYITLHIMFEIHDIQNAYILTLEEKGEKSFVKPLIFSKCIFLLKKHVESKCTKYFQWRCTTIMTTFRT